MGSLRLRRSFRAAAAVLVTTFVLAGCASTPAAQPAPAPSSSLPDATPPPTPEATGPVAAFGGACENVLTSEQAVSILGAGAMEKEAWFEEVSSPAAGRLQSLPITTLGGIECEWVAAEGAELPEGMSSISIVALPADAVVEVDFTEAFCEPSYDAVNCRMSRAHDGVWLMARAGWYLESAPVEQLDAALTAAAANLASFPPPVASVRDAAWWELPSCDDVAAGIRLTELLRADFHSGFWEGSPQPEHKLLDDAGVLRLCPWSTDVTHLAPEDPSHIVTLEIMPGAAVWWDDVVTHPSASPVTIAGAEEGIIVNNRDVLATDGVNVLRVYSGDAHEDDSGLIVPLAERALAVLNGS
ncbi:hypothetical protein H9651_05460 [Microbacterium sp. Sa4CUA7]|uniref:Uncharacterized protein n=1 Tax=Microbacterium pullorum TaxID=2762236 RepID=A0ABR8S0S4_9MICO|nr:hypothetical protein [Microbacterium pullorum]MBD7957075.1 hypothetical protein [Microbacterium pullorum]